MINITYVTADGTEHPVEVEPGMSVMEVATLRGIDGITAECGGGCSCATCHVFVCDKWKKTFEEPVPEESDLIEFLDESDADSRLSCQLVLGTEHDGLRVRMPASQG